MQFNGCQLYSTQALGICVVAQYLFPANSGRRHTVNSHKLATLKTLPLCVASATVCGYVTTWLYLISERGVRCGYLGLVNESCDKSDKPKQVLLITRAVRLVKTKIPNGMELDVTEQKSFS